MRYFFGEYICFIQLKPCWIYIKNMFPKFRVIDGEYIVKRGKVKQVYGVKPFWVCKGET